MRLFFCRFSHKFYSNKKKDYKDSLCCIVYPCSLFVIAKMCQKKSIILISTLLINIRPVRCSKSNRSLLYI
nr:MAG TPA: hypothetical protein [Bacteriophage sp.]